MSRADECVIPRDEFKLDNLRDEWAIDIRFRLHRMARRDSDESSYLVYAYPVNAKVKRGRSGITVEHWPEVFIGALVSRERSVGKSKWWALHPVTADRFSTYVKAQGRFPGREPAAQQLLRFVIERNRKRDERNAAKKQAKAAGATVARRLAATWTFQAYMLTFDSFSSDTKEIAEHITDSDLNHARHVGDLLEGAELIVREKVEQQGGLRVSGRSVTRSRERDKFAADSWQCLETYDYITRAAAIDLFIEKLPKLADRIKDVIAKEMKEARANVS